jgi:precorrin-6B methylase 1
MPESQTAAARALVPAHVQAAITAHVRPAQQTEVLLDIADTLAAFAARNDPASVATYLSEVITSLSMDRDVTDPT